MSAFDTVLECLKRWEPQPLTSELSYRNSLIAHLRNHLRNVQRIESEYRHLGTTTDVYVRQSGLLNYSEVFLELKRDLNSKGEFDRLVGQIESLRPGKNSIIVVLCGESSPALVARLKEKYEVLGGHLIMAANTFQVVVKGHGPRRAEPIRTLKPNSAEAKVGRSHALLALHKRRIRETRVTNNLYAELHQLREVFLEQGLVEKSKANRKFFDKWLTDPVVEMGLTPAGGWTSARVSDLHADLESLR